MIPENAILQYFPHETFREGQKETILQIMRYFESGYKNVCLEMPTGGGKSAIAFTISRFFGDPECFIEEEEQTEEGPIHKAVTINKKAYIVTPQKVLQDQYAKDVHNLVLYEEMRVLKGKANYKCLIPPGNNNCDSCIMQAGKKCGLKDQCEYYKNEAWTIESQTGILNYHMLHTLDEKLYKKCYSESDGAIDKNKYNLEYKRDIIIIDEAHYTEGFLMSLISVSIKLINDHDKLRYLSEPASLEDVKKHVTDYLFHLMEQLTEVKSQIDSMGTEAPTKLYKKYNQIESKIKKTEYLEMTLDNGNWAFIRDIRIDEETKIKYCHAIECKPVFVSNFANMIFRSARLKLFISATLPEKDIFCRSLGLKDSETVFIKTPNKFPVENRKTYYIANNDKYYAINQTNINRHGDHVFTDLIEVVSNIINYDFLKNEKGLIITHTNKYMNDICRLLQGQRDFIKCSGSLEQDDNEEIKDMRIEAINKHCNSEYPTVLIGPNLYEGLDLKYDLCRFVIMIKCPYPFEDEQIKARRDVDYNWYYNNVAIKIVQGLGRGIRASDDWVMNYLIDPGFDLFINGRGSKFIPSYIKQSLAKMPLIFQG